MDIESQIARWAEFERSMLGGNTPMWTYRTEPAKNPCDDVYHERNRMVAFMSRIAPQMRWDVCISYADDPEWPIVYIDTNAGQLSWHVTAQEAVDLFAHVQRNDEIEWDGHDTDEKYRRLARIGALS